LLRRSGRTAAQTGPPWGARPAGLVRRYQTAAPLRPGAKRGRVGAARAAEVSPATCYKEKL